MHFSHGKTDSRGVLIAFRKGLDYKMNSVFRDNDGRYLIIQAKIHDEPFILVNYYAPNEEGAQIHVLSKIKESIQNLETEEDMTTIWGGDFSLVFDVQLDMGGGSPKTQTKLHMQITENYVRKRFMRHIQAMFSL